MKLEGVRWARNGWSCTTLGGWHLLSESAQHLGTVFADGSWYCKTNCRGCDTPGSQPLAAQALLRAAGVEP